MSELAWVAFIVAIILSVVLFGGKSTTRTLLNAIMRAGVWRNMR